jgi:iron complex outermembrane receptor protein
MSFGDVKSAYLGLALSFLLGAPAPAQEGEASPARLRSLSIEELMEIDVTTVSRRSERMSSAAAAVTVITEEDIRRSGVTSLPEALRLANGLHVARMNSQTWAISSRGFNITTANKMLVLIDGRSVYTPLFSGVFWDVQDVLLEDVERIEVIRGPAGTLWGANAVNGVINILTKSARATEGTLLTAAAGNELRGLGAARHGGRLGERTWYRAYGKLRSEDALAFPNGSDAQDPLRFGQGGFRIDGDAAEDDSFTLQGDVYRGKTGDLVRSDIRSDGANLLGRWTRRFSADSDLEVQVYWDRTHRRVPNQFEEDRDTWDLDVQHRLPFGPRHDVVWGFGYRVSRDEVENSPVLAWVPARRTRELLNLYAQDEVSLIPDRLRLTVGSKFEVNESTGLEVQPSVRMAWTPDPRQTLWGAVSRAVRTPTRIDEDSRFLLNGFPIISGNPEFESEDVLAYELGYRLQPRPAVSLDLSAFYNVYDDLRSQEPVVPGQPFPIVLDNNLNADTYGIEARVNFGTASWWRWQTSYAWLEKEFSADPGSLDRTGGTGEGNDARYRIAVRSYVDLPGRFELDAWLRYVDELPSPFIPSYTELDLHLGWRPTDALELAIVGQNLLHGQHAQFATARPEEIERAVYGKVTWHF